MFNHLNLMAYLRMEWLEQRRNDRDFFDEISEFSFGPEDLRSPREENHSRADSREIESGDEFSEFSESDQASEHQSEFTESHLF